MKTKLVLKCNEKQKIMMMILIMMINRNAMKTENYDDDVDYDDQS